LKRRKNVGGGGIGPLPENPVCLPHPLTLAAPASESKTAGKKGRGACQLIGISLDGSTVKGLHPRTNHIRHDVYIGSGSFIYFVDRTGRDRRPRTQRSKPSVKSVGR
jgi:hypothetical protein